MHGRTLIIATLLACPTLSVAAMPPLDGKLTGATDGLMYSRAKFTCGAVPADLAADYVKAAKLIAGPSEEYDAAYQQVASRAGNWPDIPNAADRTLECQKAIESLQIKIKLAQRWFPEAYTSS
ncbi:hypothetical protein ACMSI6_04730 [Pseudomonas antarctica]|uniref:Lipoprotein n=1 Tax=Pseudomonas antarctica TaxID=219572 RepID=A0A1H0BCK6_9PSED|nr:hypothetical protein [Pseudomonas antarctica]KAF2406396.1 hypothetical protein PSAN_45710 [Pseudomonas antarctica]SDN43358.1 hypothetical protein SAMN04490179_4228 [Pseudomonas antarctica]